MLAIVGYRQINLVGLYAAWTVDVVPKTICMSNTIANGNCNIIGQAQQNSGV